MAIKPFYLVVAALLAIALAIGIFAARPAAQPMAVAPTSERPRIITVHAQGSVAVTPIGVDVVAELWGAGRTAADASTALAKADRALREALTKAGVTADQFQLSVSYPDPTVVPGQVPAPSTVRMYERLLVGDLEPRLALKTMEVTGSLGWWSYPVHYDLKDEERSIQQATERAMRTARDQAYATAGVGGMKIKGVRSVTIDPRGAVYGLDPMTGTPVKEGQTQSGSQSGTTTMVFPNPGPSPVVGAYTILWHPALPMLNADGTVQITVSITAEFDFQ